MMETVSWDVRARVLRQELASIERAAAAGHLSKEVISEMRPAVDRCRTSLWAAAIADTQSQSAAEAALLAARLVRVEEMCERIVEAIAKGNVWAGTPGLGRFLAALEATERTVKPLLDESVSAQTRAEQ